MNIHYEFLNIRNYRKKIYDSFKIIGFNNAYLNKKISLLSFTEQRFILFAIGLISNPDIIVLDNFFNSLDKIFFSLFGRKKGK